MDTLARIMTVIALLSSVLWATPAADGSWDFEDKLRASVPGAGDGFGTAVAFCEGTAVIGAPYRDVPGPDSGAAYIFEEGGGVWTRTQSSHYAWFGESVAVAADRVVVGAPGDDDLGTLSGSAYVFRGAGVWQTEVKLLAGDGAAGDEFGRSVAVAGDMVLVGAPGDDDLGNGSGSAYVLEKVGDVWTQTAKLTASDGSEGDGFGWSVALWGDVALVGAPWKYFIGPCRGSAYVFEKVGGVWTQTAKFGQDAWVGDMVGYSVALSADTAMVGAPGTNGVPPLTDIGSVYFFERIGGIWTKVAKLWATDPVPGAELGYSVGVYCDFIGLAGAPGDDDLGPASGSAYLFERIDGSWTQMAKLTASDGAQFDVFGSSVGVSYSPSWPHPVELLIGAPGDDSFSGSAYVFVGSDCNENSIPDDYEIAMGWSEDCQPNGIPDECDIADGTSDDVNGNGIPDECECAGDLDGDYDTDQADLGILLADWGCDDPVNGCDGDLNGDDKTDQSDLGILLADWGCGT